MEKQDKENFNKAVILGLGITGLGVIRNLGRNKISVIGVDSDSLAIASFSRYCTKRVIFSHKTLKENFVEYLKSLKL